MCVPQNVPAHPLVLGYHFRVPAWRLQGHPLFFWNAGVGETSLWKGTRRCVHACPQDQMRCLAGQVASLQGPKVCPHAQLLLFRARLLNMQKRGDYTPILAMSW